MASREPTREEIDSVMEFGCFDPVQDRTLVIQALKSNNCSAQKVVEDYFEDPEKFKTKYTWDDSMFTADRDGGQNNTGISFHVESPDHHNIIQGVTPPPDSYAPGAPSRPPSRTNSRSPLGRIVDWAAASATGVPNSQAQEDEDVQRALRESAQEAGITIDQTETGGIEPSASAPHFGPANRNDYDHDNWAMVPFTAPKQTPENTPIPSLRKRIPGSPAFLIQGRSADSKLGGLLTILHEIPLARNILLSLGSPAATYGHDKEWWNGQEILAPDVQARLSTGELQWGKQDAEGTRFDAEIHRLMAFLDSTERSHGTVTCLADLVPFDDQAAEKQFYEAINKREPEKVEPLLHVASLCRTTFGDNFLEDLDYENATFGVLEVEHTRSDYSHIATLYEALDHVLWNDVLTNGTMTDNSKMAMFKSMGEVFTIKMGEDGPEKLIEIPEVLYPEKYLESRKLDAMSIQTGWLDTKDEIARLQGEMHLIDKLGGKHADPTLSKREVIKKTTEQWKGYASYLQGLAQFEEMERSGFDTNKYPDYRLAPCVMDEKAKERFDKANKVAEHYQALLANLDSKIETLNAEMDRIRARQRFLGKLLTIPDKPDRPKPMTCKKYLLRGVVTSPNIVYVCRRAEADLIELDEEPSKPLDQWWRLAYSSDDKEPVKAEKTEIGVVLEDIWKETRTPLLIYATDKALDTPRAALSAQLERFVKADNKTFRQELNQETSEPSETRHATFVDPISPSKRKHRSDSADSMDSNRASLGSDGENGFENPFADETDTEMKELSRPEFARSASIDSAIEQAPPLPDRNLSLTGTTSATMTPGSETNATSESQGHGDIQLIDVEPNTDETFAQEPKAPEMEERARPPSFLTQSQSNSTKKEFMDMDMDLGNA